MKVRLWWCALAGLLVAAPSSALDEYLIGGGDTLQVNVWKNLELSQNVVVRPDGKITLPLLRDVRAEGLTAMQLGTVLAEKLSSFVNAPNVTVTVAAPTSYRVYTQGAIVNGVFTLAAPITARQLLARAGGAAADADLGRASVLRGDTRVPVDLRIPEGDQAGGGGDPLLLPGDILALPVRAVTPRRVLVVGEVATPLALPYTEGMTFLDAYLGAGGGTAAADLKNVRLARLQQSGESLEIPIDIDDVLKRGTLEKNLPLAPGDILIVPFRRLEERIIVVGEVRTPKTIAFREGLTLLDAYVDAGAGTEFADLGAVKVVRSTPGGKKLEMSVDLERILKKAEMHRNVLLAPGDIVMVPR